MVWRGAFRRDILRRSSGNRAGVRRGHCRGSDFISQLGMAGRFVLVRRRASGNLELRTAMRANAFLAGQERFDVEFVPVGAIDSDAHSATSKEAVPSPAAQVRRSGLKDAGKATSLFLHQAHRLSLREAAGPMKLISFVPL